MANTDAPFFTEREWKWLVIFRPTEWAAAWKAEPGIKWPYAAFALALIGMTVAYVVEGDSGSAILFLCLTVLLLTPILLAPVAALIIAPLRAMCRIAGLTAVWVRIRGTVQRTARVLFWLGFCVLMISGLWPFLSTSPIKSWYAFRFKVPAANVEMTQEPHDCEFTAAPLGAKNCHYEPQFYKYKLSDAPGAESGLSVTYERVND